MPKVYAAIGLGIILLAGCLPDPGAQSSSSQDFSDFNVFEFRGGEPFEGGLARTTIRRQSNGQYEFRATVSNPSPENDTDLAPPEDSDAFQLPPRELTPDEVERMQQVFSHVIVNYSPDYPICIFYIYINSFRWDEFEITTNPSCGGSIQWLGSPSFEEIMDMLEDFRLAGN